MERVVIKIGIVLNYKAAEKKKDELFSIKDIRYGEELTTYYKPNEKDFK